MNIILSAPQMLDLDQAGELEVQNIVCEEHDAYSAEFHGTWYHRDECGDPDGNKPAVIRAYFADAPIAASADALLSAGWLDWEIL